jgi:hypothetical protein
MKSERGRNSEVFEQGSEGKMKKMKTGITMGATW